jgi:hypothetical protein
LAARRIRIVELDKQARGDCMNALTTNRLSEIAETVKTEHSAIDSALRESMARAVKIGALLTEAKQLLKHGEWLSWLADNCQFSERTAQNYMRIYNKYPQLAKSATVADLSYREAIGLLADPKAAAVEYSPSAAEWLDRIKWANEEGDAIKALADKVKAEIRTPVDGSLSLARQMLETSQRIVNLEELHERASKYFEVMRGAMIEARRDEVFKYLSPALQQKVIDWAEAKTQGLGGVS